MGAFSLRGSSVHRTGGAGLNLRGPSAHPTAGAKGAPEGNESTAKPKATPAPTLTGQKKTAEQPAAKTKVAR